MADISLYVLSLRKARPSNVPANLFSVGIESGNMAIATTFWPAESIYQAAEELKANIIFDDQEVFDNVCKYLVPGCKEVLLKLSNVRIQK